MEIVVDFDGTCVTHAFPSVGEDIGAAPVLRKLVAHGHKLILFTMRNNRPEGAFLDDAVKWFEERAIPLYGIQTNPKQKSWSQSPKAYGHLYIDDVALGCPLANMPDISPRPFVDWARAEDLLIEKGYLPKEVI